MFNSSLKKVRFSLFLKVSLSFAVACVLVIGLIQVFMLKVISPNSQQLRAQDTNRSEYTLYLLDHLGLPPDPVKARKMAKDLDLEVRVEGAGSNFSIGSVPLPPFDEIQKFSRRCPTRPVSIGKWGKRIITTVEKNSYRYTIAFQSDVFSDGRIDLVPLLIGLILLVFTGCYFWIQWLFRPLHPLMEGVRQVSAGNLEVKLAPPKGFHGQDEIGTLADAFNEMVQRVRGMIQSQQQLLLDVSHELRSPLTRMKLALELGGDEMESRLSKNVDLLEKMTHELLESARLDSSNFVMKREGVELGELIQALVFEVDTKRIRFSKFEQPLFISADSKLISRAIKNLIENALKYSMDQEKPVDLVVGRDLDSAQVIVTDHGCGIPEGEVKKIFEPFYRIDKSRDRQTGGYGLGLSLCKKVIESHQGQISVHSEVGKFTQVRIFIPLMAK